jgi:hypothetical protein
LFDAHNSVVGDDRALGLEAALATARKRVYDRSLSPSPTIDDAPRLEIGDTQVDVPMTPWNLLSCHRVHPGEDRAPTALYPSRRWRHRHVGPPA